MPRQNSKIIKVIKKTMPAVVSIIISKKFGDVEKMVPQGFGSLKLKADDHGMIEIGGGSGFFVEKSGVILTNRHVITDSSAEYTIITNGKKFSAEVLARDPIKDVAIIKVKNADGLKFPILKLGDSSELDLGEMVLAIGNVLGIFENTVSLGIISGLSRTMRAQIDPKSPILEMRGLIQTDAAINPGNSGGPLINDKGEVVGINAAIISGAENIGLAIPINNAKRDLEDLKKYGRIKRPLLGIRHIIVDDNVKEKLSLAVNYGAMVTKEDMTSHAVAPESPAAKAGILEEDIILECNGEKISKEKTLQDFLDNLSAGDKVNFKILRNNKELNAEVVLAEKK